MATWSKIVWVIAPFRPKILYLWLSVARCCIWHSIMFSLTFFFLAAFVTCSNICTEHLRFLYQLGWIQKCDFPSLCEAVKYSTTKFNPESLLNIHLWSSSAHLSAERNWQSLVIYLRTLYWIRLGHNGIFFFLFIWLPIHLFVHLSIHICQGELSYNSLAVKTYAINLLGEIFW